MTPSTGRATPESAATIPPKWIWRGLLPGAPNPAAHVRHRKPAPPPRSPNRGTSLSHHHTKSRLTATVLAPWHHATMASRRSRATPGVKATQALPPWRGPPKQPVTSATAVQLPSRGGAGDQEQHSCDNPPKKISYYHLNQSTLAIKRQ
jgi:hypothetical protein